MECQEARQLIIELLYNELSEESAAEIQNHLLECGDCLKYMQETQKTIEYLDKAEELREPLNLAALHESIENGRSKFLSFLRRPWPVWVTISACALLLAAFALFATEIRYEDGSLTIRFKDMPVETVKVVEKKTDDKIEPILADYRQDQLKFQRELRDELRTSVASLSQLIKEYEDQRDEQLNDTFQQIQIRQNEILMAIQKDLENLATQTEDEFRKSYMTMAAVAESLNP